MFLNRNQGDFNLQYVHKSPVINSSLKIGECSIFDLIKFIFVNEYKRDNYYSKTDNTAKQLQMKALALNH